MGCEQSRWIEPVGQPRSVHEHGQLAILGRRSHLDSPEGAGEPAAQHGWPASIHDVLAKCGGVSARRGRHGTRHLVEAEVSRETERTADCSRSFGCPGRLTWWSNKKQAAAGKSTDTTNK